MEHARFEDLLRSLATARSRRRLLTVLGGAMLAAVSGSVCGIAAAADGPSADPARVFPDLAGSWLAWATRRTIVPATESGAVDCAAGQEGPVWFLAGSGIEAGPIARRCAVLPGTRLFFPVVSAFCAELKTPARAEPPTLSACAASFIDLFPPPALTATVNGDPAPIVRAQSPLLPISLEPDNPFAAPAGDYLQTADGYWVLLDPLPAGSHTIHVTAAPEIDVTYELTVA